MRVRIDGLKKNSGAIDLPANCVPSAAEGRRLREQQRASRSQASPGYSKKCQIAIRSLCWLKNHGHGGPVHCAEEAAHGVRIPHSTDRSTAGQIRNKENPARGPGFVVVHMKKRVRPAYPAVCPGFRSTRARRLSYLRPCEALVTICGWTGDGCISRTYREAVKLIRRQRISRAKGMVETEKTEPAGPSLPRR